MSGTTELSREAWLEERRKSIGASDAPAILNRSPWSTPLGVYFEKLGMSSDRKKEPAHLAWGLDFQPAIAGVYSRNTGKELILPPALIRNPETPWMHASMDYLLIDGPLEIKRVNQFYAKDWGEAESDEIPEYVYLQCQQQMHCGGYQVAYVGAFIGWDDFRPYTIQRNQKAIDGLIEIERDFMRRVEEQDPPMPDWEHPSTADILAMIEPIAGESIDLDSTFESIVEEYEQLGKVQKSVETERDGLKARLLHAMGTAEIGYLPDGRQITRKVISRKAFTVEATSYVKLGIKSPKPRKVSAA